MSAAKPIDAQIDVSRERGLLENEYLRVQLMPERGGKLVSLTNKRTGTEWLLPPMRPYEEAHSRNGFESWDGGGFDECLPTVAATDTAPDHGEVWRTAWTVEPTREGVTASVLACGGDIRMRRSAKLQGVSLVLEYSVENVGSRPRPLLYSAHPLLRVQEGDRIVLPEEVRSLRVESSIGNRHGSTGDLVPWSSAAGAEDDLSKLGPPDGTQADKLFAGPLREGWCRLVRPSTGEALDLSFNAQVLPYLGIWICRGAWPEQGEQKQYTVGFEPTNANCDSLTQAGRNGTAWILQPGEKRDWLLRFDVTAPTQDRRAEQVAGQTSEREL